MCGTGFSGHNPTPIPRTDRTAGRCTTVRRGQLVRFPLMRRVSRRAFLMTASVASAARGTRVSSPRKAFTDGLTGREVERLTQPTVLHHLPAPNLRCIARNGSFVVVAAEHGGSRQFHRLDIRRERLTQITEGLPVHPYAAHLRANDRGLYYLQGSRLVLSDLGGRGPRVLYECPDGWTLTGDLDLSLGERYAALVEMRREDLRQTPDEQFEVRPRCRIVVVECKTRAGRGTSQIVLEDRRWLSSPCFRPLRSQLLYKREGPWQRVRRRLQIVSLDGTERRTLRTSKGSERTCAAYWSADGALLRFTLFPDGSKWTSSIRSLQPETGSETVHAPCSAYDWMAENSDASTILGASRRPAGPNIYVLFPNMAREITLCEHRSTLRPYPVAGADQIDTRAACPAPSITRDSSWVYFVSDWEGKPALYRMAIDDLVEETNT